MKKQFVEPGVNIIRLMDDVIRTSGDDTQNQPFNPGGPSGGGGPSAPGLGDG